MKTKICLSIGEAYLKEISEIIEKTKDKVDLYEIRIDYLKNPKDILDFRFPCKTIYTFRPKNQGGLYEGSEEDRINLLLEIAKTYPSCLIDLEYHLKNEIFYHFNKYCETICSLHKFYQPVIKAELEELLSKPAEFYKIAIQPGQTKQIFDLLSILKEKKKNKKIIFLAMGNKGVWTRILSLYLNNLWSYIAYSSGKETAEGQISLYQALNLYRIKELDPSYKVYGIIGKPLEHSISPVIHNFAFKYLNYKGVYVPFEIDDIKIFLKNIRQFIPLEGLSVTLPFKKKAIEFVDYISNDVLEIGAINTIKWIDGKWFGYNTDYKGFENSLLKIIDPTGLKVLVLGAGGVASSIVYSLKKFNAKIIITSRNYERANELAQSFNIQAVRWEDKENYDYDILINATPVGMHPQISSKPIEIKEGEGKIVYDLIYNPAKTLLLEEAEEKGAIIINGLDMLIEQAMEQLKIWVEACPPKDILMEIAKNLS